jgi:hypothetical protein
MATLILTMGFAAAGHAATQKEEGYEHPNPPYVEEVITVL